ncbi:MAG: hypothetical protein J5I50_01135 [Chitinophagaceae bacterium]|nr:hypothetical protein [Chitinophagaceae bacterium]
MKRYLFSPAKTAFLILLFSIQPFHSFVYAQEGEVVMKDLKIVYIHYGGDLEKKETFEKGFRYTYKESGYDGRKAEGLDVAYYAYDQPIPDYDRKEIQKDAGAICKSLYDEIAKSWNTYTLEPHEYSIFMNQKDVKKLTLNPVTNNIEYAEMYGFKINGAKVITQLKVCYVTYQGTIIGKAIYRKTLESSFAKLGHFITVFIKPIDGDKPYRVRAPKIGLSFELPHYMTLRDINADKAYAVVKFARQQGQEDFPHYDDLPGDFILQSLGPLEKGTTMSALYQKLFGIKLEDDACFKNEMVRNTIVNLFSLKEKNPDISFTGFAAFAKEDPSKDDRGIRYALFDYKNRVYLIEFPDDPGYNRQATRLSELSKFLLSIRDFSAQ